MKIFSFTAKIKESNLVLNSNTRPGCICRYIMLKEKSEDVSDHQFNYELKISQLPDHVDLICDITSQTTVLNGLSTNKNEFSAGTTMIGQARTAHIIEKSTVEKKTSIADYFWGEVFFGQGLFESIEKTLQNNLVYKVAISGLKYKKKDLEEEYDGKYETTHQEDFVIESVELYGVDTKINK
ncbi:MAG: hypothetical protein HW406_932 [Candidatus Brocadiaceae bacterium]|nr:hypothetical protein [Candidatus Brocadiaceae bacterium]